MVSSVRILKAGHCKQIEKIVLPHSGKIREVHFPSTVAVIEHSQAGIILFDTGYSPRFHEVTRHFPEKLYALATPVHIQPEETALFQLEQLGIRKQDVSTIVLSHLHADHISGTRDFSHSRFILEKEGWDFHRKLSRISGVRHAFLAALLPDQLENQSQFLNSKDYQVRVPELTAQDNSFEIFGADLLGDESVLAIPLPGHCPGQIGLFVRPQSGTPLFFVADAAWSSASIENNELPSRITNLIHHEPQVYKQTLSHLHQIHRHNNIELIPCHCESALIEHGQQK